MTSSHSEGLDAIRPEDAPSEAMDVVKFCNNLPLAIGMAGGILRSMSLGTDGDWSGVVAILKDEFGEGKNGVNCVNSRTLIGCSAPPSVSSRGRTLLRNVC